MDPRSSVPLHDTTEETPCSGSTMNPVGAENGMRIYEKINNNGVKP